MSEMYLPANIHAAWLDAGYQWSYAATEHARPSVLYRPALTKDGDRWCALYGSDLVVGVCGFGDTPAEAMSEFDKAWVGGGSDE